MKKLIRESAKTIQGWINFLFKRNLDSFREEIVVSSVCLGEEAYNWTVIPDGLDAKSIIYSAGVGENTSFDEDLIKKYGVEVHLFDFTPRAIKHVAQHKVSGMHFHPYGLADKDGEMSFYAPFQEKNVSWSSVPRGTKAETFPVKKLSTIMRELGHDRIDILKMDIEGAEYEVLEDMLLSGVRPKQLLVEFQHRFEGVGVMKTKRMIRRLQSAGYKIFSISNSREEFSFVFSPQLP